MPHIKKYYDNYVCLIEIFGDRCSYFDRAQKAKRQRKNEKERKNKEKLYNKKTSERQGKPNEWPIGHRVRNYLIKTKYDRGA